MFPPAAAPKSAARPSAACWTRSSRARSKKRSPPCYKDPTPTFLKKSSSAWCNSSNKLEWRDADMSPLLMLVSTSGLLDLVLKSAAVMLLALVAATLLGRASAAWRHLIWCLSVASLLLMPALSLTLPTRRVTWLPQWTAEPTQLATTGQTNLAQADRTVPLNDLALDDQPPTAIVAPTSDAAAVTAASNSLPAPDIATTPQRSPLPLLAIGWATGGLLSLIPLAAGLFQLAALHRRSRVMND